jgi:DNA-directed RNA polymerase subunit RPC12/RpoP
MSIKVIFACHQCGAAFEARQEHTDGQGEFACTDCGLTVHDWHGQYDYTRWAAFTPALLVRQNASLIGRNGCSPAYASGEVGAL